jgi:hypothetical protein
MKVMLPMSLIDLMNHQYNFYVMLMTYNTLSLLVQVLPTHGTPVPYRRDLFIHGYLDGRRLPCPGTEFDAKTIFDAIKDQGVTSFITVPTIMAGLLSCDSYEIALQFSEILGVCNCWCRS